MRRIPRAQWIEWLDGLRISGKVAVVSDDRAAAHSGGWLFHSADYDPFDDVVEIVLHDDRGRLRVLVESPTEILAVGTDYNPDHVTIIAPDGPFVITRSLALQRGMAPTDRSDNEPAATDRDRRTVRPIGRAVSAHAPRAGNAREGA